MIRTYLILTQTVIVLLSRTCLRMRLFSCQHRSSKQQKRAFYDDQKDHHQVPFCPAQSVHPGQ
ncbi:hypothetical protein DFP92_11497 [Yoonia sediminilitoris]|nr:hypothetical protein DFP92_11497 [Yoonia sediminilitoris]